MYTNIIVSKKKWGEPSMECRLWQNNCITNFWHNLTENNGRKKYCMKWFCKWVETLRQNTKWNTHKYWAIAGKFFTMRVWVNNLENTEHVHWDWKHLKNGWQVMECKFLTEGEVVDKQGATARIVSYCRRFENLSKNSYLAEYRHRYMERLVRFHKYMSYFCPLKDLKALTSW